MSEALDKTADSTGAREALRAGIKTVTSESIAEMYSPPAQAKTEADEAQKEEAKAEPNAKENSGKDGKKNSFQERVSQLVKQRNEAEAKADAEARARQELEARVKELQARPDPVKEEAKPKRSDFVDDEQFIESLTTWKANQAIAKREREQAEAQAKEAQETLNKEWAKRQKKAMADIDDYYDVIGTSEVHLPSYLNQAILESENGPLLAYYFAKHADEAKRFSSMTMTTALPHLGKLEAMLMALEDPKIENPKKTALNTVEVSKAPAPTKPVKETASVIPGTASNFEDYRAKRQAEQSSRRR